MYGDLAGFRAYAAERGNMALTDADATIATAALVRASDYIRTRYVLRLSPEYSATAPEVIEATYIAAALELATPGFWSTTYTPSTAKVLTGLKGITWTLVGGGKGADGMLPTSPAIDSLLTPLTRWGMPAVMVV